MCQGVAGVNCKYPFAEVRMAAINIADTADSIKADSLLIPEMSCSGF